MKIELEIDGQMIEGEFTLAEGAAQLSFGGATREAQVSEPEPGMFTVIINDRVFRCALEESPVREMCWLLLSEQMEFFSPG